MFGSTGIGIGQEAPMYGMRAIGPNLGGEGPGYLAVGNPPTGDGDGGRVTGGEGRGLYWASFIPVKSTMTLGNGISARFLIRITNQALRASIW